LTDTSPPADFTVAVVDDDPKFRTKLAMQLGERKQTASFPSVEALEDKLGAGAPVVVVLGPSCADDAGLKEAEALIKNRSTVGAILMVEELSTQVLQQALRSGVKDVLNSPAETGQLVEAIDRVAETLVVGPRIPTAVEGEEGSGQGRLITVFSTKGGAGKSVIASNLAVVLNRRVDGPVALVDADLQFGDVAVMLKMTPQHTIVDAVAAIERIDPQLMQSLLIRHDSGVLVLAAPVEPAFADQVSGSDMLRIVNVLREFCAFVVVDTPAYFNDVVLALLEESDDIVLVAGMDIPNIKNVKIGLQTLRLLNTPVSKLKLVLNRANSKVKLDVSEVERTLGIKADCLVPSEVAVPQSVNKGIPIVIDAPKTGVAKSLEQLADLFHVASGDKRRRR
jgi:pilus assembly protein CpaE